MPDTGKLEDPIKNGDATIYHQRYWKVQKAWWIVLAGTLVAGFLGFFGAGPLSGATIEEGNFQLHYERFAQRDRSGSVYIQSHAPTETFEVSLSRSYLDTVLIEEITPDPDAIEADTDRVVYAFSISPDATEAHIEFVVRPRSAGILKATIEAGGEQISFRQFVLP